MRPVARPWLLLLLLVMATGMDAVNSSVLVIAREPIMGGVHATPDEIAWVNMAYLAAKLTAFPVAAWLSPRIAMRRLILLATLLLLASSLGCAMTEHLPALVSWRIVQGIAGAVLLVAGQLVLFALFPARRQGIVQALFAFSVIMAPTTLTPALQGWALDNGAWPWIFLANLPLGACGLMAALLLSGGRAENPGLPSFDWIGTALLAIAMTSIVFLTQEGSRYNWLDEPLIVAISLVAVAATVIFVVWQFVSQSRGPLIDFAVFRDEHFSFGFLVSFVAGSALFGSAFIIPAFALGVLSLSPTYAGLLLLPSGLFVGAGLLAAGALIQFRSLDPAKPIPLGIICFMTAMWMMSGSTAQSGLPDLMPELLLRGLGLGLLFVSLTLVTLGTLREEQLACGIALFSMGRQLGGQMGIAWLGTYLDHQSALNRSVLSQYIVANNPALLDRQQLIEALLISRGYNAEGAGPAAMTVIQRALGQQVATLSFNECFFAVAILFLVAAPLLVTIRLILHRISPRQHGETEHRRRGGPADLTHA